MPPAGFDYDSWVGPATTIPVGSKNSNLPIFNDLQGEQKIAPRPLARLSLVDELETNAGVFFDAKFNVLNGILHILGDPNTAPVIATQPLAQTNTLGARTRFSVAAQGAPPLSYQWYRGNERVPTATAAELILPVTTAVDDADFYCLVENGLGSIPTAPAHLTLLDPAPGSVYRETDLPAGPDDEVHALVFDEAGGLLATGRFSQWNNITRTRLARLLPGTVDLDPAFASPGLDGTGLHLLPLAGGKVLSVGFTGVTYNGKKHDDVIRFNANGSVDTTPHRWQPTSGRRRPPAGGWPAGSGFQRSTSVVAVARFPIRRRAPPRPPDSSSP